MSSLSFPLALPLAQALPWLQQALLYVHLFAFAIAIAQVIRLDLAWLRTRDLRTSGFESAARTVLIALCLLWATGLALVGLSVGLDWQALLDRPKLVAKLVVVALLSLNGIALHHFALPRLDHGQPLPAWTLGAISTVSWTAAALIGAARHVAPSLGLADYLAGYAAALVAAIATAWTLAASLTTDRVSPPVTGRGAGTQGESWLLGDYVLAERPMLNVEIFQPWHLTETPVHDRFAHIKRRLMGSSVAPRQLRRIRHSASSLSPTATRAAGGRRRGFGEHARRRRSRPALQGRAWTGGGSGWGRLAGGEERSRTGGAKRLHPLTRGPLFERSERRERSELGRAPVLRAPQRSLSEAKTSRPAPPP